MSETPASRVAAKMSDYDLFHVARVLEAELVATMAKTGQGGTAEVGKLEMLQAVSDELVLVRGYHRGHKADGSDLPRDVTTEHAYGSSYRTSSAIRVF